MRSILVLVLLSALVPRPASAQEVVHLRLASPPASVSQGQPTVRAARAVVTGGDPRLVTDNIARQMPRIQECYSTELRSSPTLSGRVEVEFRVAKGRVVTARVGQNTTGSTTLAACVMRQVKGLSFPSTVQAMDVVFPFLFALGGPSAEEGTWECRRPLALLTTRSGSWGGAARGLLPVELAGPADAAWTAWAATSRREPATYAAAIDGFRDLLDARPPEALKDAALTCLARAFVDQANLGDGDPLTRAQTWFDAQARPYRRDALSRLSLVMADLGQVERAMDTERAILALDPLAPDAPQHQARIAHLAGTRDDGALRQAYQDLIRDYGEGSAWWKANAGRPQAMAGASPVLEESASWLALDAHLAAQKSGRPEDYVVAVGAYRQYLSWFPFAEDREELEWYLADALYQSGDLAAADAQYQALARQPGSPSWDGARFRLLQVRHQSLVSLWGKVEARPEHAVLEQEVQTPFGAVVKVYALDAVHKAFIEAADSLVQDPILDPSVESSWRDNLPALTYLPALILFEFGRYAEARPRLEAVIQRYPHRDEGAYAAALLVRSYEQEGDLEGVRATTARFAAMNLGSQSTPTPEAQQARAAAEVVAEAAAFQAALALTERDRAEAARAFLAFYRDFPASASLKDALFNAGNSLDKEGRLRDADRVFEAWVARYPKDERAAALLFRLGSSHSARMELTEALGFFKILSQTFPNAPETPAALGRMASLEEGLGHFPAAAQAWENLATHHPQSPDAEASYFRAGRAWEEVGPDQALAFWKRYLARFPSTHPDHALQAQARIVEILQEKGSLEAEGALATLVARFDEMARAGTVSPESRHGVARVALGAVWERWTRFQEVTWPADEASLVALLLDSKPRELGELDRACQDLTERYQDLETASAAVTLQATARIAWADLLREAPTRPGALTEEARTRLDQRRTSVEEEAKAMVEEGIQKARDQKAWTPWQDRLLQIQEKWGQARKREAWVEAPVFPAYPASILPIDLSKGDAPKGARGRKGGMDKATVALTAYALDPKSAVIPLRELEAQFPTVATVPYNLGLSLEAGGDLAGAEAAYKRALALSPDLVPAWNRLMALQARMSRPQDALRSAWDALRGNPGNRAVQRMALTALLDQGRYTDARGAALQVLAQDPQSVDGWVTLSAASVGLGDPDRAAWMLEMARGVLPGADKCADLLAATGQVHMAHGDPAGARVLLEQAIALEPSHLRARVLLARHLGQTRDWEGALQALEPARTQGAGDLSWRVTQGLALKGAGRFPEARAALEAAVALDPDRAEPRRNLAILLGDSMGLGPEAVAQARILREMAGVDKATVDAWIYAWEGERSP